MSDETGAMLTEMENLVDLDTLSIRELNDLLDLALMYQKGKNAPTLKRDVRIANLFLRTRLERLLPFRWLSTGSV